MSLIRFEDVSYIYGEHTVFENQALKNISLSIESGSFVGIAGHTGSGKSTLIQHMNGLLVPTSGKVYFHEKDIRDGTFSRKELCSKVGLVFQYPEDQLFETSVLNDAAFGPKNLGLGEAEAFERAKDALKMTGIDESLYDRSPFELSGGQRRRVAIAGVLAMKPEVLILDEPAAGLDPQSKHDIFGVIGKLRKETSMTVILSSHSMEDVAMYADRMIVMNEGEIVRDGDPGDIFEDYRYLESIGLSAPEMSYIMYELRDRGYSVKTGVRSVKDAADSIMSAWKSVKGDIE